MTKAKAKQQLKPTLSADQRRLRLDALTIALNVVANGTLMLNNTPLNRDIKGVLRLAEVFYKHAEGYNVIPGLMEESVPEPQAFTAD